MAKDFFKQRGVDYAEVDVFKDIKAREEMIKLSGQMGVPVIVIGDNVITGFNPYVVGDMLDKTLENNS